MKNWRLGHKTSSNVREGFKANMRAEDTNFGFYKAAN